MSQALTLFTTPVVYLYFDRLQHWWERVRGVRPPAARADGIRGIDTRHASSRRPLALASSLAALALAVHGCLKVPPYQRPTAAVPQSFKEAPPAGLEGGPAERRSAARQVVGDLRRPRAQRARRAGGHLQPERIAGRGAFPRKPRPPCAWRAPALFPTVTAIALGHRLAVLLAPFAVRRRPARWAPMIFR